MPGEKANFPHLMGIQHNTCKSNGYSKPQFLFNDIIQRNSVSTAIIPNKISPTSKMYKKALNFTKSTDIFRKNKGPLTINYNPALRNTKLNIVFVHGLIKVPAHHNVKKMLVKAFETVTPPPNP